MTFDVGFDVEINFDVDVESDVEAHRQAGWNRVYDLDVPHIAKAM